MDLDKILAITFSGLRAEEESDAKDLLSACRLPTQDLTSEMLRQFLVARKGHRVIGIVGLQICGQDGLLRSLAVADEFRGQRIAARLTDYIARHASGLGIKRLYLFTMTARKFFANQGYGEVDRSQVPPEVRATREFQDLCPETAVCMVREL